jgi:hypothetical protein
MEASLALLYKAVMKARRLGSGTAMDEGELVYRTRSGWRVRIVQAAMWIGTAALIYVMVVGSAESGAADLIVAWVGTLLMAAFLVGVEIYLRLYVIEVRRIDGRLRVTSLATLHHRVEWMEESEAVLGDLRHDRSSIPGRPIVDNQWRPMKRKGRLPLILDVTPGRPETTGSINAPRASRPAGRAKRARGRR